MPPTRRAAEQERFGAAHPGEAQADEPALEREMIDEGADDGLSPVEVVKGLFGDVFNAGELNAASRSTTSSPRATGSRTASR